MQLILPYIQSFEAYLAKSHISEDPISLYEPIKYLLDIGGKRIRPACALMAYDLYKNELDEAMPVAMAVELFHNFTLMHDDIMDQANLRRGQQTVHVRYDKNTAILSGDMMLIMAYRTLEMINDNSYRGCMHIFNKMAGEVCEGQRWDMDFEHRLEVTVSQYLHMISLKTSVLLAASMQMGALIGGASEIDQHHIYEFGKNIGIAFQIQDDYLDLYGDDKVGKKIGGDVIQNKKTYLTIKALELAVGKEREALMQWFDVNAKYDETEKITGVKQIFDSLVVGEYAKQVMDAYRDLAISHLQQLHISDEHKTGLIEFADFLVNRNH